jgi:hypothetical protein
MTKDTQIITDTEVRQKYQKPAQDSRAPLGYYGDSGFEVPDNPDPAFNPYVLTYSNSLGLLGLIEENAPMMSQMRAMPQARQSSQTPQSQGSAPKDNTIGLLMIFILGALTYYLISEIWKM